MNYETVIGLEIHAQLLTKSKLFCGCSAAFGGAPNANICPICTGQPGVLPVINKKAVELTIKTGLALNCQIAKHSVFARKHYFYPDLPKNFQISQYELPLCSGGYLEITVNGEKRKIGITRVHLEEDAGKLVHPGGVKLSSANESLVDLNRTGVPLMEIVSQPDLRSPEEAKVFMENLAHLLEYLGVCDAKLEEGSLRCDANISLRPAGDKKLGVKVEVKNMNSFKAVYKALLAEEKRQRELLAEGEAVVQETRYFDESSQDTVSMRGKEFAQDYRYFPEPDLVPLEVTENWIEQIKSGLEELPARKHERFIKDYGLSSYDAELLVASRPTADFFEKTIALYPHPKIIANWVLTEINAYLNEHKLDLSQTKITPTHLAQMLEAIDKGTISGKIGKSLITEILRTGRTVDELIKEEGLTQITDEKNLLPIIRQVIKDNPKSVEDYKKGKETAITFLVGQVMKVSKGRANPSLTNQLMKKELGPIAS